MPPGHAVKDGVFFQQEPCASRVYLLPGHAVPVDAGSEAPAISEVAGLIDIAAFPHDTVCQCIEEKKVRVFPEPLHKSGNDKAAKTLCAVVLGEKAHFPDFNIVSCDQPVPGEYLANGLQGLCPPAQHYHTAKAVIHEKAQVILVEPGHDFGIVVLPNKGHRPLLGYLPHRQTELRAKLARSGLTHSVPPFPPGGWS